MVAAQTPPNPADQTGNRPVPDPTVLTTDALRREIAALDTLIASRIKAESDVTSERFRGIRDLLDVAERQRVEQKMDTKAAVDAALTAQKEAVREQTAAFALATDKSERAVAEQLRQLGTTFTAALTGVTIRLDDLKERQTRTESLKTGGQESRQGFIAIVSVGIAAVIAALAAIGIALGVR